MNIAAPVIVPALVAGLVWLIVGRLWTRPPAPALVWGGSLAVAMSFYSGHVALLGWPPFPPVTAIHSLAYAGLVAGVVGIAESRWRSQWAVRWMIRAGLSGGAAWWQFNALAEHTWSTAQTFGWLITVTVTVCVAWEAIDTLATRRSDVTTPLLMWMFACAASVGLVFGASAMLGQLAGCVAAGCGAAILLALWSRNFPLDRGAAGLFAFIVVGLLWQGFFYAELPLAATALLIAAPIAACSVDELLPKRTRPIHRFSAIFGTMAVAAGLAIVIAYLNYRATALEVGDYAY